MDVEKRPAGAGAVMADWDVVSHEPAGTQSGAGDWDVVSHEAAPKKSLYDRVKDAIIAPEGERDPDIGTAISGSITGIPEEIGKQFTGSISDAASALTEPSPRPSTITRAGRISRLAQPIMDLARGARFVGDVAGAVMSPVTGALTSAIGRPVEELTGVRRDLTGSALSLAAPFAGARTGARAVGGALSKMREAGSVADATGIGVTASTVSGAEGGASYQASVKALQDAGVELTPGQMRGGGIRRIEEAHKSDPLIGEAIRGAEDKTNRSFNRAMYNKVLEPIGVKYAQDAVGTKGVKAVGDKISAAYEEIKPDLKLKLDDDLQADVVDLRARASEMPADQERQFENILQQRVMKRLTTGEELDGSTFKQIESELLTKARNYKSSSDAAQRELGDHLEELTGALRDGLERNSEPGVRDRLKAINTSWAMLVRLEGAAGRRAKSGGVFTPNDLLGAVKATDKSTRKRAFARGDALMQDIATSADEVMSPRMPDSGTAERLNYTRPHSLLMYGASRVTNAVATQGLRHLASGKPIIPPQLPPLIPKANALRALTQSNDDQ